MTFEILLVNGNAGRSRGTRFWRAIGGFCLGWKQGNAGGLLLRTMINSGG